VYNSGLNNVRLNTVTDNSDFSCVRISSFVVVVVVELHPLPESPVAPHCRTHEIQGVETGRLRDM